MSVIGDIRSEDKWNDFLHYKQQNRHLSKIEEHLLINFISEQRYLYYYEMLEKNVFPSDFPHKSIINKYGTDKKRVVYTFAEEENIVLKFIAHQLFRFDNIFSKNCYAFRKGYGVKNAISRFKRNPEYAAKYCFKADIHNYFNSIDIELLINKMYFLKSADFELYSLLVKILHEDRVYENGSLISEFHGAMAGIPVSPFFANIYLSDTDKWFEAKGIDYFRYSDDILIFADSETELNQYMDFLYASLEKLKLKVNPSKVRIFLPGEVWDFLGFSYDCGKIGLSANTMQKIKAKIKHKADALRRWQRKKQLSPDKAAIGFIRAMNMKFYGLDDTHDFTWKRWFFPNLTEDTGLKEIDAYMQEYIRYIITGRHYKGNYRITYNQMKDMGYRSLVNEYYKFKKGLTYTPPHTST